MVPHQPQPPYPAPPPPPPFGPYYVPPKPPPDIRTVVRTIFFIVSLPILGLVVYIIVQFELEKKRDLVVFDNRFETTAEVYVDGKKLASIAPHVTYSKVVTMPKQAKHIEVRADGKVVSGLDVAFPPRGPNDKNGYRGLYVIGPPRRYVLAKVPYFEKMPSPPVYASKTPLPLPSPLAELPRELESYEMDIDGVFLDSENVPEGTEVYWKKHLCTLDDDGTVGCHGFPNKD
jgi:hypothetical protein